MPLTKSGNEVLSSMKHQYGDKKGESVFYASINAHKSGSSKWHLGKHIQESARKMQKK